MTITRLPRPVYCSYEWQEQGLCRGKDAEQFFIDDPDMGQVQRREQTEAAKRSARAAPSPGPASSTPCGCRRRSASGAARPPRSAPACSGTSPAERPTGQGVRPRQPSVSRSTVAPGSSASAEPCTSSLAPRTPAPMTTGPPRDDACVDEHRPALRQPDRRDAALLHPRQRHRPRLVGERDLAHAEVTAHHPVDVGPVGREHDDRGKVTSHRGAPRRRRSSPRPPAPRRRRRRTPPCRRAPVDLRDPRPGKWSSARRDGRGEQVGPVRGGQPREVSFGDAACRTPYAATELRGATPARSVLPRCRRSTGCGVRQRASPATTVAAGTGRAERHPVPAHSATWSGRSASAEARRSGTVTWCTSG